MAVYLAYTGMDAMFLTDDPDFTPFKTVYVRDEQYTTKVIEQTFDQTNYNVGDTLISTLKQNGDFLMDISLKVILPNIVSQSGYWVYRDFAKLTGKSFSVFDSLSNEQLYSGTLNGTIATTSDLNWFTLQNEKFVPFYSVASVSCGGFHTAYVTTTGDLHTVGLNVYGQLGDGTNDSTNTPVLIETGVASVSCGGYHTAYVKTNGGLYTFGSNETGQLGDGTNDSTNTPVLIETGVASVSCGGGFSDTEGIDAPGHTAYVKTNGDLYTVGFNDSGQLGDGNTGEGTTSADRNTPVLIDTGVASVSCGGFHTAYVKTNGELYTTGYNLYGQLGDDTYVDKSTPVLIDTGVSSVSCGLFHTAYAKTNGELYTTGLNSNGQLGDGSNDTTNTPVLIDTGVASVSCGGGHTAYVKTNGGLYTVGYNDSGQLGNGSNVDKNIPILIVSSDVSTVSCGGYHTAFVKTSDLYTVGFNNLGQLGDGTLISYRNTPVQISGEFVNTGVVTITNQDKFLFSQNSCYIIFSDISLANFFGFANNPVQLLGGYVSFNNASVSQLTFQESGWVQGDQMYDSSGSYLDDTMYKLINSVSLYIGKQLVQEFDSSTIKIYKETNSTYKNRPILKLLEGNDNVVYDNRVYYFDIPFISIPVYAIQRHDVQIRIKTNPLSGNIDFFMSLVLTYGTFSSSVNLPSEYTIHVPTVSYFNEVSKLDMKGPVKKIVFSANAFSLSLNGEPFVDDVNTKIVAFENFMNVPVNPSSNTFAVLNNPINMSRIRDQTFLSSSSTYKIYAESINILKITNNLSGLMYATKDTSSYPTVTGSLINTTVQTQPALFYSIPLTTGQTLSFYSMRLVSYTYTGPVIRLRNHDTDFEDDFYSDTTQSFLRTSNGTSVSDFLPARVVTWYDQFIQGNNLTQVIKNAQPSVVLDSSSGKYVVAILNDTTNIDYVKPSFWFDVSKPVNPQQFLMTVKLNALGNYIEPITLFGSSSWTFRISGGNLYGNYEAGDWASLPNGGDTYFTVNGAYATTLNSTDTWYNVTSWKESVYSGSPLSLVGIPGPGFYQTPQRSMNGYFFELGFMNNSTLSTESVEYYDNRPPL